MKRTMELLAPGGDIDSIKAAILAGADAVYCGLDKFNARNRAANITLDDLSGILRLAHAHQCKVFLTLNIIIVDSEIAAIIALLNKLVNTGIDGIIVQDPGLLYLLSTYYKRLKIHASTQLTTHNEGQIMFLGKLAATRVNLSRELNIHEIKALTAVAHAQDILTEVFVHGSNCLCFSGICYMSSVQGGNSGNRGRCSQPCRDQYATTPAGKDFPLNLKDNSAYADVRELYEAGVDSVKIEGRIKKFHYVYTIVEAWRKQLDRCGNEHRPILDNSALYKVFNRDFSNAFLRGDIHRDMFIDNPRDNSAIHVSSPGGLFSADKLDKAKGDVFDERTEIITKVDAAIQGLSIAKVPLTIHISGECGSPLRVSVRTPDTSFVVLSEALLTDTGMQALSHEMLLNRLKVINETEYFIEKTEMENLRDNLFLPFKELTSIKRRLLFVLNGSREFIDPMDVPVVKKHPCGSIRPALSVLISSQADIYLGKETNAELYFQLPDSFKNRCPEFLHLFRENKKLIPWFPSILIGEDFSAAVEFLQQLHPDSIVTENSGIAYEAGKRGIPWIAGPGLNIVNSFSLICLKEKFNCSGAFISNEISRTQIKGIKNAKDFKLFYSIYHPIVLMTSRQCLFHQVTGCEKERIDGNCIAGCSKTASIGNLKNTTFILEKSKGCYHRIYNETHFLNTDIVSDFQDLFTGFFIDVRDIPTKTCRLTDKAGVVRLFENLLDGDPLAKNELSHVIYPTTDVQYRKGI